MASSISYVTRDHFLLFVPRFFYLVRTRTLLFIIFSPCFVSNRMVMSQLQSMCLMEKSVDMSHLSWFFLLGKTCIFLHFLCSMSSKMYFVGLRWYCHWVDDGLASILQWETIGRASFPCSQITQQICNGNFNKYLNYSVLFLARISNIFTIECRFNGFRFPLRFHNWCKWLDPIQNRSKEAVAGAIVSLIKWRVKFVKHEGIRCKIDG